MHRIAPAFFCLATALIVHADMIELDNGQKTEGNVLSFVNQRFDVADQSGSISHFSPQRVKRIDFDSSMATIMTSGGVMLHGQLLGLQDGSFLLTNEKGEKQMVPAAQVTDLTVSRRDSASSVTPAVSSVRSKPALIPASSSRPQAKGSLRPERGKITIFDFYADWCGPCRHIGPILEKIAEGNPDIVLRKINIDKRRDLAHEYNVTGIPRILIYDKNGGEVDTVIGANELAVRQAIEAAGGS